MYHQSFHVLGPICLLLGYLRQVVAQPAAASCLSTTDFGWATNVLGQDPCLVAHDLFVPNPCGDTTVFFPTLSNSEGYPPPTTSDAGPCLCNTVIYSLATACASCQGSESPSWTEWTANCPATLYQQWPDGIPSNTAIPPWAYLPLDNSQWDLTQAQDNATGQGLTTSSSSTNAATTTAQSTSISQHSNGPSTPSSSSPASEMPSDRTTSSNGSTPSNASSSSKSSVSPPDNSNPVLSSNSSNSSGLTNSIIGGVVGGVTGVVGLIALVLFVWCRRSRIKKSLKTQRPASGESQIHDKLIIPPQPMVDQYPSTTKLYNPDDPSTFPPTPPVIDIAWTSGDRPPSNSNLRGYTGIPEL
ncbi:hypothetical protein BV22DRAFT_1052065 [Leucogyrophana mollusca]|uniref:Uncharacterized protein n=1 Tax=Leucogyrophana mollusca TaxID=85980 RepID=A0ACB8AWP4_9AGAM|nr:hypothetical protein BV22DRAFT_1052065 [Leucogyrophana mollusca]